MAVDFDKLMSVFREALEEHPPEQWDDFVQQAAGGDEALYRQARQLLHAHARGHSLLDKPVVSSPTIDQPITEKPGTQIGPYKLLQQLGEGGMGVVYMAEQKEPVKRRVALKIIRPGMDTRQVIARFEAERQALAMMDHPNIARVLDAGQTDSGRPYFVMELVNGLPVTKYCDEQHLTPKERLELFVPICQAVQHAHQKGIIHRDLKPSNILVALYDSQAVPKIIDFGVAKATSQTLTEKTMFTQLGQVVGTLEYMSPEQAERNQLDIDTRSDIYSLGVVLYELLTGETPFDRARLRSAAFDEMLRIIREEEPSKPSTKVCSSQSLPSIAANRRIEPAKLGSMIRGELDWIVLKAMEKDRRRRYETATGLANDIERYLHDEAVVACPPSAAYRFRKLARRNKIAIGTASAVAISLIVGIVGTTWQAHRARKAERDALAFAAEAQVQAERADKEAEAALQQATIARCLAEGDYGLAEREVLQELESHRRTLGEEHRKTLSAMNMLAIIYHHQGRHREASGLIKRKLEVERRTVGDEHPSAIQSARFLANLYRAEGRFDEAERLQRRVLELSSRTLGREHEDTLRGMSTLAEALCRNGELDGAIDMYQELCDLDPENASALRGLAGALRRRVDVDEKQGRLPEMIADLQRIIELLRSGPATQPLGLAWHRLGKALSQAGHASEAELAYREALTVWQLLADESPDFPYLREMLGSIYRDLGRTLNGAGRTEEAEAAFRQGLTVWQQLVERFPNRRHYREVKLGDSYRQLGHTLNRRKKCAEALACFERSLESAPHDHWSHFAMAGFRLHASDLSFRDPQQAARAAARAVELKPGFADSHRLLGEARYRLHEWAGAVESLTKALELGLLPDARTGLQLAICYAHLEEQEVAVEWYAEGLALVEEQQQEDHASLAKLREGAEELLGSATPQVSRD